MLGPVSGEAMRAAQILTGATMAAWLACGFIPAVRPYVTKLRTGLLAVYLVGCIAFVAYMLLR